MRRIPPLPHVQAFEAASRLGSFNAAALELGLTPSAISHRIRSLEKEIGLPLFYRGHRAVTLTDAGERYSTQVAEGLATIEAATRSIERQGRSDILTIHCVPSLATQWLMPRLSRYSTLHPNTDLRLHAAVEEVDLAAGEADFAIRYGTVFPGAGIEIEPFPEERIVVLCAPKLAYGSRPVSRPEDLPGHVLIHSEVNLISWRIWQRNHPGLQLDLERGPRFDRSFMAISAAIDGQGIALESQLLIQRELQAQSLVLPLGAVGPEIQCHSLLFQKSKRNLPKVRAFRQWLFRELEETFDHGTAKSDRKS